jgi:hypothetical protein
MGSAVNGALRARRRSLGATSDRKLTRMSAQGQTAGRPLEAPIELNVQICAYDARQALTRRKAPGEARDVVGGTRGFPIIGNTHFPFLGT